MGGETLYVQKPFWKDPLMLLPTQQHLVAIS